MVVSSRESPGTLSACGYRLGRLPTRAGWWEKFSGKNSAFRAGVLRAVYDQYRKRPVSAPIHDQSGVCAGMLNRPLRIPVTYLRFHDDRPGIPLAHRLPQAPAPHWRGFPLLPLDINAIAGSYNGISSNLKAPYSYVMNATLAREVSKFTIEAGYVGRLSHKLLLQGDIFTLLEIFKDPVSGSRPRTCIWRPFPPALRQPERRSAVDRPDLVAARVAANPSLVPTNAFVESMFPALKNAVIPGSASANYGYRQMLCLADTNSSYLDNPACHGSLTTVSTARVTVAWLKHRLLHGIFRAPR